MEFPFNINPLFGAPISLIDKHLVPYRSAQEMKYAPARYAYRTAVYLATVKVKGGIKLT